MDGPLAGGNMNAVERRGDCVLRTAGPWTPTVHRYLRHLADAGIDWVPRPLGVEGAREVLSFLDGDVPLYPLPAWVWSDAVLIDSARRLRRLHDASVGFPIDDAQWQLPARTPSEVICHNDFAPYNLVFVDGRIVGAIDFDTCSPGPRLWDLAYLAVRTIPLTAEVLPGAPTVELARPRADLLLNAYVHDFGYDDLLRVAILRLRDLAAFSRRKAVELAKPELVEHAASYERDASWLAGSRRPTG